MRKSNFPGSQTTITPPPMLTRAKKEVKQIMPETNLEVCISITNLEKFNALIETLKHRMQEAGEGAARLKEVIKKFTDFKLAVQTVHAEKDCD